MWNETFSVIFKHCGDVDMYLFVTDFRAIFNLFKDSHGKIFLNRRINYFFDGSIRILDNLTSSKPLDMGMDNLQKS